MDELMDTLVYCDVIWDELFDMVDMLIYLFKLNIYNKYKY